MVRLHKALSAAFVVAAITFFVPVPGLAEDAAPATPAGHDASHPADPFGEEVTLTPKPMVYMEATATLDNAYDTLVDALKTLHDFLDHRGVKPSGPPLTIYTATDDSGVQFKAALPVAEELKDVPHGDIKVGMSPEGKALKFIHRGSYDDMDTTYGAIANFLDERKLDAKDLYIEQYDTDPVTTPEQDLVIEVLVPVK